MGHVEAAHLEYYLPDGRALLGDVSFRVGDGAAVALVGPNGSRQDHADAADHAARSPRTAAASPSAAASA